MLSSNKEGADDKILSKISWNSQLFPWSLPGCFYAVHGVMSTRLCICLRRRSRLCGLFFRWAEFVELSRRCSFGRYFQHSISDVIAVLTAMSMTRVWPRMRR